MTLNLFKAGAALAMAASLSACVSLDERKAPAAPTVVTTVSAEAEHAEVARVAAVRAQPQWSFQAAWRSTRGATAATGASTGSRMRAATWWN